MAARDPKIVGNIPYYRIEDFPRDGEPEGERYILMLDEGGTFCSGYRDGEQWIADGGDPVPVTPIYWARAINPTDRSVC